MASAHVGRIPTLPPDLNVAKPGRRLPTPTPQRVAHRFASSFFTTGGPSRSLDLSNAASSTLSAAELRSLLEPTYGLIAKLRFKAVAGSANTATWEAVAASGTIITGRVVLHAAITVERVTSCAEVIVEDEAIPF